MRVSELGIPDWLLHSLGERGIRELYPHQAEAVRRGLLEGRDIVVAAPTASGKTLIATLAAERCLRRGRKVLYLTPLRALTSEKYAEFSGLFAGSSPPLRIAAASSDYDDPGDWLGRMDFIVATYEKADSLIRHNAGWMGEVGLLVIDEVHMIGDRERGPTLEMTIAKMLEINGDAQLLCLSATIKNVSEIADWLGAEPLISDFRPVPLREGVFFRDRIRFKDGGVKKLKPIGDPLSTLVMDSVEEGGQTLVFALTRRRAEQYAARLADVTDYAVRASGEMASALKEYAGAILEADRESPFSERLAQLVAKGAAFHHAGLGYGHRRIIEEAFRARVLPVICATPTLAAGVNLPARTVVIPELRRYDVRLGLSALSVMEYKQLCGRAGRPTYDKVGYAVIVARGREEAEILSSRYIHGKPEKIVSSLGSERHLRSHVLSLIATGLAASEKGLRHLMERTLFARQFGFEAMSEKMDDVLSFLERHGMVLRADGLVATRLGVRVSQLYVDPLSAVVILQHSREEGPLSEEAMLQIVCLTPDVSELRVARIRRPVVERYLMERMEGLVVGPPDPVEDPEGYELYLDVIKNVALLKEWINERPEREIYDSFIAEPGDFAALRERAEWLSYAASQLTRIAGLRRMSDSFSILTERIRHGVRAELIPLVSLPDIGRVRGRALWDSGYRSIESLASATIEEIARIPGIGSKIAQKIKERLAA